LEKIEMKKTLVAVAALAAVAGAHAEATISGLLDAAITINGTSSTLGDGPNGGNEFTLGMSEDLGGGLKAIGAFTIIGSMINNGESTGVANSFGTYNSFVGLSGDFGSIKLGSQWNPVFLASTISDATGRWGSTSATTPVELQNAGSITYTSPSISGVSVSYQKQLLGSSSATIGAGQINNTGSGDASAYSLNYAAGPFAAAYAVATDSGSTMGNTTFVAASYDFGMAKLHFGTYSSTVTTAYTTATSVGISAPIGNAVVSGMWGTGTGSVTTSNYAVMYNLSKRTAVYYNIGLQSNAANSSILGMKHAF